MILTYHLTSLIICLAPPLIENKREEGGENGKHWILLTDQLLSS